MKRFGACLILLIMVACRKDADVCNMDKSHVITDLNDLVIGTTSVNEVVVYGSDRLTVTENSTSIIQNIDLLNDCKIDIELVKDKQAGKENIYLKGSSQILFFDQMVPMVSYTSEEHSYHNFTGGVEHYIEQYRSNILPDTPYDYTENYAEQAPYYFQPGETFSGCPNYSISHRVNIRKIESGTSGFSQTGYSNDTIHFSRTTYLWDYYFPPQNEKTYIAFSFNSGLGMKYGWIKLSSSNPEEATILEYALQR